MAIVVLKDKDGNEYNLSGDFKTFYFPKYVLKEEDVPTIKYVAVYEETKFYKAKEVETIKFIPKEATTIKYVPKEVIIEKPVIKNVNLDVPSRSSLELVRETVLAIIECLRLLPDLVKNLKVVVECAKEMPTIRKEFIEMKEMIEGYEKPKFREVEVIKPIMKDKVVFNPQFKDVEVINPIIRDKPMTVDEAREFGKKQKEM